MKLTVEKLTQIIREEVESVISEARKRPEWARGGANYDPERARERYREKGDVDNFGPIKRKERAGVPEETFDKIIDAVSELPGTPGKPEKKSDEQGAGYVALRDFFLANEDFYKELIRQADLAWMEAGPEDKITDALHADDGLFSKVDPQMVLAILNAVSPAKFAHLKRKKLKESETAADIMKALERDHGWDQKEFSAISGGAYGDDLTPEERSRLDNKYDELVKKDAVKALLKQYAQARRAERKGE